ncbi:hypothetical protein CBS101457_004201 [Exobasidium rhododendri]|nr:hypothetical protein CBS101457_004201 [Exobasidium rhododendri]
MQESTTVTQGSEVEISSRSEGSVESGYVTPEEEIPEARLESGTSLSAELDMLLRQMDNDHTIAMNTVTTETMSRKPRRNFPISQFTIAQQQTKKDSEATVCILNKVKVLAYDPDVKSKHRYSLYLEKQAIRAMSIDCTLNIGQVNDRTTMEKMQRLSNKYDKNDEQGKESFQKVLLMVLVRLLRHMTSNEKGDKKPGTEIHSSSESALQNHRLLWSPVCAHLPYSIGDSERHDDRALAG